jgi:hypothetical protein
LAGRRASTLLVLSIQLVAPEARPPQGNRCRRWKSLHAARHRRACRYAVVPRQRWLASNSTSNRPAYLMRAARAVVTRCFGRRVKHMQKPSDENVRDAVVHFDISSCVW